MGKTTAQKDAHAVKDGIRHKDVYITAVGDTAKAYFFFPLSNFLQAREKDFKFHDAVHHTATPQVQEVPTRNVVPKLICLPGTQICSWQTHRLVCL